MGLILDLQKEQMKLLRTYLLPPWLRYRFHFSLRFLFILTTVVAVLLAVNVSVELPLPGAAIDAGLKLAVTPAGIPVAERLIAELNPPEPEVEIVVVPELP